MEMSNDPVCCRCGKEFSPTALTNGFHLVKKFHICENCLKARRSIEETRAVILKVIKKGFYEKRN